MLIFFIAWRNAKRWNSQTVWKKYEKYIKEKQIKRKRDMATEKKNAIQKWKKLIIYCIVICDFFVDICVFDEMWLCSHKCTLDDDENYGSIWWSVFEVGN